MKEQFLKEHPFMIPLEKKMSEKRFAHTIRVARCAHTLASDHHVDPKQAVVAALLHDCAKNYDDDKLIKLANKYEIEMNKVEKAHPDLLHSKVGAYEAGHRYQVHHADVFNAIYYHTTGRPSMGMLEKIIYIADYIEPKRKAHPALEAIRSMAHQDLNQCMAMILKSTIDYLSKGSRQIDPLTLEAYHYYQQFL